MVITLQTLTNGNNGNSQNQKVVVPGLPIYRLQHQKSGNINTAANANDFQNEQRKSQRRRSISNSKSKDNVIRKSYTCED